MVSSSTIDKSANFVPTFIKSFVVGELIIRNTGSHRTTLEKTPEKKTTHRFTFILKGLCHVLANGPISLPKIEFCA